MTTIVQGTPNDTYRHPDPILDLQLNRRSPSGPMAEPAGGADLNLEEGWNEPAVEQHDED